MIRRSSIRPLILALVLLVPLLGVSAASATHGSPTVTVDSLATTPPEPKPTDQVRATAAVRASAPIMVDMLVVAARNQAGQNFDFPNPLTNVALTTSPLQYSSGTRTFPGGAYTYFVSYLYQGVWHELAPVKSFVSANFRDEFAGPGIDWSKWFVDGCWTTGCGNQELQEYTAEACTIDAGQLVMSAYPDPVADETPVKEYESCRLTTFSGRDVPTFSQAYGHFEARVQVPAGATYAGLLSGFWTLGHSGEVWPARGEFDILENRGQLPMVPERHAHGQYADGTTFQFDSLGSNTVTQWHTYAIDWTPDYVRWTLDGVSVARMDRVNVGTAWASFDHPHAPLLSLAVGGVYPGPPGANNTWPARMRVDYVRVW